MAKNDGKGSKGATTTATGASAPDNAGIIFEVMPEGFAPPMKAQVGQWDAVVTKLCSKAHLDQFKDRFVTLYKSAADDAEPCNTRAKGVRKAAKKLNLNVTVAVRQLKDAEGKATENVLLARGVLGTPKTSEAK